MALAVIAVFLLAIVPLVQSQLPNARIGLHPSGDGPDLFEQAGYPILERDLPFGERYQMKLKYYNAPRQPLSYKDKRPFEVACW